MKLVVAYWLSDSHSLMNYPMALPIEYESKEKFLEDFQSAKEARRVGGKQQCSFGHDAFRVGDHLFDLEQFTGNYLPDIFTVDEWFAEWSNTLDEDTEEVV